MYSLYKVSSSISIYFPVQKLLPVRISYSADGDVFLWQPVRPGYIVQTCLRLYRAPPGAYARNPLDHNGREGIFYIHNWNFVFSV